MSACDRDVWYEFQPEDLDFARSLTDDAERLYAAGAAGDTALCYLAAQHDAEKFGKVFSIPVIELHSRRWRENTDGGTAFKEMARKGLPEDAVRNSLPVEVIFHSSVYPDSPPVRMAGILYIGSMLKADE